MTSKIAFFIFFSFLGSAAFSAEVLKVSRGDGSVITAYLSVPPKAEQFSVFAVLQGSSCKSVHGAKPIGFLEKMGFARLDVEKRGLDETFREGNSCPEEYLQKNDIFQRARDISTVLNFIRSNYDWSGEAYLVGGSEGAVVAPIVAHRDPSVKGIGLLAGAGGMLMAEELKLIVKKGTNICGVESPEKFDPIFQQIFNSPDLNRTWCGRTNSFYWWSKILRFKPLDLMKDLSIPIYVAHGTLDTATPVESSDLAIATLQGLGKNIKYSRYDGLDHGWNDQNGESQFNRVFGDLLDWFAAVVGK